jgi:hypothetical protein
MVMVFLFVVLLMFNGRENTFPPTMDTHEKGESFKKNKIFSKGDK